MVRYIIITAVSVTNCAVPTVYAPKACASFTDVGQKLVLLGCCTMPNQATMFHMVMGEVGNLKNILIFQVANIFN